MAVTDFDKIVLAFWMWLLVAYFVAYTTDPDASRAVRRRKDQRGVDLISARMVAHPFAIQHALRLAALCD
jgi:hypothetical protein